MGTRRQGPSPAPDLANQARGRWGEGRAAAHYRRLGYTVVDRNWRTRHGEIDLIVRRADLVVFCEVKARRTDAFGGASAAVDERKQARLRRLAAAWLAANAPGWVDVRFDVVAITGVDLVVIEAAF